MNFEYILSVRNNDYSKAVNYLIGFNASLHAVPMFSYMPLICYHKLTRIQFLFWTN
jgi:hypothetical protein